jgi:hypothetical protein
MQSRNEIVNPTAASTAWLHLHTRMDGRIRIYVAPSCKESSNRIELSSGTRLAGMREITNLVHGTAYEEGARLPREPWRLATKEEYEGLVVAEAPSDMATSVAIVKLPGEFSDDRRQAIRSGNPESREINLFRPLRTICQLGEPLHCHGLNQQPGNLKTATINRDVGRYIGLHVDIWDRCKIDSLHLATNRICVNVGQDDRYFLFLPISLMAIASVLSRVIGPDWKVPRRHTDIARQFMEQFPDTPVIRCRLAPGEAYIAPTENLVHDGSSVGQSDIDELFTLRGHIRPS